jgi:hypothetical protein
MCVHHIYRFRKNPKELVKALLTALKDSRSKSSVFEWKQDLKEGEIEPHIAHKKTSMDVIPAG